MDYSDHTLHYVREDKPGNLKFCFGNDLNSKTQKFNDTILS